MCPKVLMPVPIQPLGMTDNSRSLSWIFKMGMLFKTGMVRVVFNERRQVCDETLKLRNQEKHPDQRVNHAATNLGVVVNRKS